MLKTYNSKAIWEPCTRIQKNSWYGKESLSLDGSENEDEEGRDDEDVDDDFGVENLEFNIANFLFSLIHHF